MENYGFLSLIPPILAIVLAIYTREVLFSLFVAVLTGMFILSNYNILGMFTGTMQMIVEKMADGSWNAKILLFCALLGAIIGLINRSGGADAFAKWAAAKIKSRASAQIITWLFGLVIFVDDYFNSLTIGSVMRPVTDKFKVSREKLAYILDATAAADCVLIPLSTWVGYILSILAAEFTNLGVAETPFMAFIYAIPRNFYSWLTLFMVAYVALTNFDFGLMAKAERRAMELGQVYDPKVERSLPGDDFKGLEPSPKGKISDLVVPIVGLIIAVLISMLALGGFFKGATIKAAFEATDSSMAMVYGTIITVILAVAWSTLRRVLTLSEAMEAFLQGVKSMVVTFCILILAWSIGGVCSKLGTGNFVAQIVKLGFPVWLIPFTVFIASCIISFATGTSWGTFAVMLPIALPMAHAGGFDLNLAIAAVLAGGIFGDHCSPISDTTILSSTGAGCFHIDHVRTQIPYAVLVAAICGIGYFLAGLINNFFILWPIVLALLVGTIYVLRNRSLPKTDQLKATNKTV